MKKLIILLAGALTLAACQAKIDATDAEAYAKSLEAVTKDFTDEQKRDFHDAVVTLAFDEADPANSVWKDSNLAAPLFSVGARKFEGLTGPEIIKKGLETRVALLDKKIAGEAAALKQLQDERKKHAAVFDRIAVTGARYYVSETMFMREPVIAFTITNGSNVPLKRVYMVGKVTSPGRTIPWIEDDFNYEFPGGLEPGETKSLELNPNMFSGWLGDFSGRKDLKLDLKLDNVEGPDGEPLIKGTSEGLAEKTAEVARLTKMRDQVAAKLKAS